MKRRVGRLYNKPVIEGDKNLKTTNEIHIDDLCDETDDGRSPLGIGVLLTSGEIIDYNNPKFSSEGYSRNDIYGITLQDNNISIVISPDTVQKAYFCGGKVVCTKAQQEVGINGASSKFIGEEATATLRGCLTDQSWAVNKAYNTLINGQHCYLPYQGELIAIYNNRKFISDLLVKCGCSALPDGDYWSSALLARADSDGNQTSNINDYLLIIAGVNFTNDEKWGLNVQGYYNVLPVIKLSNVISIN